MDRRAARHPAAAAVLGFVLALGGCAPASETARPSASAVTPSISIPADSGTSGGPSASLPSTTTISWGTIWDAVPSAFPRYPGAEPTQNDGGAASAVLAVPATASVAADWYRSALEAAGYDTEALVGPSEDGSYAIDSTGTNSDCQVRTTIARLGSQTTATILFAAGCPFR